MRAAILVQHSMGVNNSEKCQYFVLCLAIEVFAEKEQPRNAGIRILILIMSKQRKYHLIRWPSLWFNWVFWCPPNTLHDTIV